MSSTTLPSKAPVAPWSDTVVHAVVGLFLFAALMAGAVFYLVFVLLPELLRDRVELIFERYNTLLPDLSSGGVPVWVWLWTGAGVLGAATVTGAYAFLRAARAARHPGLFWGWLGALAVLVVPPVVALFVLPTVPKFPGGGVWWFLTAAGLTGGFFYVAWMYYRDSHGVGPLWASLLGLLRGAVFTLLAFFFMLPAVREFKDTFSRSKVIVVFDVSGSMVYTIDDIPDDSHPLDKLPTRQDKVLAFLQDPDVNFLKRLEEKNPIDAYRFAKGLDPEFLYFGQQGDAWMRAEHELWLKDPNRDKTPPPGPLLQEFAKTWLKPTVAVEPDKGWDDKVDARFRQLQGLNDALQQKDSEYTNGTNVADSLLSLVDNESRKMVQGVVVFTDGRETEGSSSGLEQLKEHAQSAHIPIFVVGIGEERPKVKLEIADVRAPQQIQPDDKFPVVAELTGEGLPDKEIANLELEITEVAKGKDGKETLLPIGLVESVDLKPGDKTPELQKAALGTKIVMRPAELPRFDKGSPPRVEVQFQIDPEALAEAAKVDLKGQFPGVKKWELVPTPPDAELRLRVHVPRDPLEIFGAKEHVSDPIGMVVQKKPLRVLLFASAALHEYQFVQAIMVRDTTKGRVKVSSYIQVPPGRTEPREGVLQDATLLKHFPDQIDKAVSSEEDKQYDLSEYDVIVAFDPDWSQLSEEQIKLLKQWADKGGGLIYVAGPINTVELARPREDEKRRFGPILELLPVRLKDIRLAEVDRKTDLAWPLDLSGATPEMEFLKLAEDTTGGDKAPKFLDDWKEFFGPIQPDGSVGRGFYNFYPVEKEVPGAKVAARFADPSAKTKDGQYMPYIVLSNPNDPDHRVVWLGWDEMWRLRQKNEAYLERFWTKLTRYAGGVNQGKVVKRITPNFGRTFTVGQQVVMEARIDDKGGVRLNPDADPKPKVMLTPPLAGPKTTVQQQRDLENLQKEKWMTYKPKSDGWWQVTFKPPIEGDYQFELTVPQTGDKVKHKFTVKPSNPELDDARPDFARMYSMASYADEDVQPRLDPSDYSTLLQKLRRPKLDENDQKEDRPKLYFNLENAKLIPNCMVSTNDQRRDYSDPRAIWDEPVAFRWLPVWAVALLGVTLTGGVLVGFFLMRNDRTALRVPAVLRWLLGIVSAGGYLIGRSLGVAGFGLWALALVALIGPLFLPHMMQLGWYAFAFLVGLMSMEWLIRKLLRLA